MNKRVLLMIPLLFMLSVSTVLGASGLPPSSVFVQIDKSVYRVDPPAGSSGTFSLKTASGATKFIPSEAKGNYLDHIKIRYKGALTGGNYIKVILGNGTVRTFKDKPDGSTIDYYFATEGASKGVTVQLVLDGTKEKYAYVSQYSYVPNSSGNATPPVITPESDPVIDDPTGVSGLSATFNDPVISWGTIPSGTTKIKIFKDGSLIATLDPSDSSYDISSLGSGNYSIYGLDSSNNVIAKDTLNVNSSSVPEPDDTSTLDPSDPDYDDYIDNDNTGGSTCICESLCEVLPIILSDLTSQLGEIHSALAPLHDDLQSVNEVLQRINANTAPLHNDLLNINDSVDEVVRQLTPTQNYDVPNPVQKPDYYKPNDIGHPLPDLTKNNYFQDAGDASTPSAIPIAPDPKNWTVDGVELNQDSVIIPSTKQYKETSQSMSTKQYKETSQSMTTKQVKQGSLIQDAPLTVKDKDYPLRWKSSDYKP